MVKTALVGPDIEAGRELLQFLDDVESEDFTVESAFWNFDRESDGWELVIATPIYEKHGPRYAYQKLQRLLGLLAAATQDGPSIELSDIRLVGRNYFLVGLLKAAVRGSAVEDIRDVRISGNFINGVLIDDAYIYRLS